MTAKFEDRHLELRETLAQRGAAWREGEEDGAEVIAASRRLDMFRERTGPLVDDLAAAVRAERDARLSERRMRARGDGPSHPEFREGHLEVMAKAREAAERTLAALDEEAARG